MAHLLCLFRRTAREFDAVHGPGAMARDGLMLAANAAMLTAVAAGILLIGETFQ